MHSNGLLLLSLLWSVCYTECVLRIKEREMEFIEVFTYLYDGFAWCVGTAVILVAIFFGLCKVISYFENKRKR